MLVLTRRQGQRIELPELGVSIVVAGVVGRRVRIGVSAPRGARIVREEILSRPAKEARR